MICTAGRFKTQAKMEDAFKRQVGAKQVKAGQLLLLACPGARVYTYDYIPGSDIRLVEHSVVSVPPAYMDSAISFAKDQTDRRAKHKKLGKAITCTRDWHMEMWTKAVCTLQYAFWDGIISAPIHCEGNVMVPCQNGAVACDLSSFQGTVLLAATQLIPKTSLSCKIRS